MNKTTKTAKSAKGKMPAGMYADGGMAKKKAMMGKVADEKVEQHEAKMHGKKKMADGGKVMKYADGGMVCGHKGGMSGKNMKK